MRKQVLISIGLFFSVNLLAQVDTLKTIVDFREKALKVRPKSGRVLLREKLFYSEDTSLIEGSFLFDYPSDPVKDSNFHVLSIYEKEYQRYLVFTDSGVEYVIDKNETVKRVKKIDKATPSDVGLGEPLLPILLDRSLHFEKWFFEDFSRIKIESITDSAIAMVYLGKDTSNLKCPPILILEIFKESGLPKSIKSWFVLTNGEVQYQFYSILYDLNKDERDLHIRARKCAEEYGNDENSISYERDLANSEDSFFESGDTIESIQLANLKGDSVMMNLKTDKYTLLDFTYISCKPCIEAVPALNQLTRDFNDKLEVVAINPFDKPSKIVAQKNKVNTCYDTYTISNKLFQQMHISRFPFFVLVGKDGIIKWTTIGYGSNLYDEVSKVLRADR